MTDTERLGRWNRDFSRAIATLGSDDFFPALVEAVRGQVKVDCPHVRLYHRHKPPESIYQEMPESAVPVQVDRYLDGAYREDPFYHTFLQRPRARIYRLSRVTMGKLEESAYYRDYYSDTGTVDEVVYMASLRDGCAVHLGVTRQRSSGLFNDGEYEALYLLAEPVTELIRAHCEYDQFAVSRLIQPGIDHQIDLAFRTFGSSLLSPREKDVLELMLRGHGTLTSAQRLNIAMETVRRHRKSIYRKLDVSSQTDLFSLFLNSMSRLAEAAGGDPLAIYMAPAGARSRLDRDFDPENR